MKLLILAALMLGGLSSQFKKQGAVNAHQDGPNFWDLKWKDWRLSEAIGSIGGDIFGSRKSEPRETKVVVDLQKELITIDGVSYNVKQNHKLNKKYPNHIFKIQIDSSQVIKSIAITMDETGSEIDGVLIQTTTEYDTEYSTALNKAGLFFKQQSVSQADLDNKTEEILQSDSKTQRETELKQYAQAILLFLKAYSYTEKVYTEKVWALKSSLGKNPHKLPKQLLNYIQSEMPPTHSSISSSVQRL